MKISNVCNGTLTIQANMEIDGDYQAALTLANKMVADSDGTIDLCSSDECEGWVQVAAAWDNYQAKELRQAYNIAKKV